MIATCRARDRLAQSVAPVPPPAATGGVSEGFGDRTERLEAARTAATGLGMGRPGGPGVPTGTGGKAGAARLKLLLLNSPSH